MKSIALFVGADSSEEASETINLYNKTTSLAATIYEGKLRDSLIKNYDECLDLLVTQVSWFPKHSRLFRTKTKKIETGYSVGFNNLVGLRDFSIYFSLKKNLKKLIKEHQLKNREIDVLFATPFLYYTKLAKYIKKKLPLAKIVYDVQDGPGLDSPEYKGLAKTLKKYQQKMTIKNMENTADGYVLMSQHMTELFDTKKAEILVIEGIAEENDTNLPVVPETITYTGGIYPEYIPYEMLSKSAKILKKQYPSFRYNIAGWGDQSLGQKLREDKNFIYLGPVSKDTSRSLQKRSNILMNLRINIDRYKYSFPSKTFEYLATGNPIISTNLGCYSQKFKNVLFIINDLTTDSFVALVDKILSMTPEQLNTIRANSLALVEEYSSKNVGLKIKNLFNLIRNKTN